MPRPSTLIQPIRRTPRVAVDEGGLSAAGSVLTGSPPTTLQRGVRTSRGPGLQWALRRNCSLTPRQVMLSFLLLCAIELAIGAGFWLAGFPLIALFSAMELLALAMALVYYGRHACDQEIVTLHADCLAIDTQCGTQLRHTEFQPAWVRVAAPGGGGLVRLSERGVELQLGRHVRPLLRDVLGRELQQALAAHRRALAGAAGCLGAQGGLG